MFLKSTVKHLFFFALIASVLLACAKKEEVRQLTGNPKIDKLKLPDGFVAELLYSPGENDQGSWVAMTFDDKGRMITSDQYGFLYRLELPPIGSDSTVKPKVEKLIVGNAPDSLVGMGYAQGLLYAFNSLYVMVKQLIRLYLHQRPQNRAKCVFPENAPHQKTSCYGRLH